MKSDLFYRYIILYDRCSFFAVWRKFSYDMSRKHARGPLWSVNFEQISSFNPRNQSIFLPVAKTNSFFAFRADNKWILASSALKLTISFSVFCFYTLCLTPFYQDPKYKIKLIATVCINLTNLMAIHTVTVGKAVLMTLVVNSLADHS